MADNSAAMHGAADVPGPESAVDIEAFLTGETQAGYQLEADMSAFPPSGMATGVLGAVSGISDSNNGGRQIGGPDAMLGLDSNGMPFFGGEDQDHEADGGGMDALQGLAAHGGSFEVVYANERMYLQPVSDLGIPASSQADSEIE